MTKKILVAEDDEFLVNMYKINLEQTGYDVQVVMNGEQAIQAIDESQPDILLLDLLMPKVDGFGVLQHIKEKAYTFPIMVFSNLSEQLDEQKCKDLGATDYYVKSDLDLDEMIEKIDKYLM